MFFFEKKNQKTFSTLLGILGDRLLHAGTNSQKFFASFFQKRSAFFLCLLASPAWAQIVQTQYGELQGSTANGVSSFKGVPYATPPVGALRWVAPTPPASWNGVRQALAFGSQCAQPISQFGMAGDAEDCLYLNVETPVNFTANSKLPVMVWIHGGAFITGEGWDYDASSMVTEDNVVVVTLNYRLGLLGFMALPSLAVDGDAGNYGLLDQQFAVKWVRQNIAGFGGDPAKITIFGESAGGQSVIDNVTSPGIGKLHGAIAESGSYAPALPTIAQAETTYAQIVSDPNRGLDCAPTDAVCLRALTPAQLVAAINPLTDLGVISPIVDGTVLPAQPFQALNSGAFQHVPIINGSNHDEWRLFVVLNDLFGSGAITPAEYPAAVEAVVGSQYAQAALAQYPLSAYPSPNYAYAALVTDQGFACGAHLVNALAAQYTPVYSYELNDPNAPDIFLPFDPNMPNTGDSHASELPYLYPTLQSPLFGKGPAQFTAQQQVLAKGMRAMWTSFARYGRPLNPRGGIWQRFNVASDEVLSLVPPSPNEYSGFVAGHQCLFWKPLLLQRAGLPGGVPY